MRIDGSSCPARDAVGWCTCPKRDCPRHGLCCACVRSHLERAGEPPLKRLPHCVRPVVAEALG